jgi:flagellar biosynthesis protein FlhB
MAEDSDLEKTEDPTSRRLSQARERGQVPHSRELGTFLVLLVGAATCWTMGGWLIERFLRLMQKGLVIDARFMHEPEQMVTRLSELSTQAIVSFAPVMVALLVASIIPSFILNSFVFTFESLTPNLSRLNLLTGISRMFSWNGLVELLKAVLKSLLVGGVAVWVIWRQRDELMGLLAQPLELGLHEAGNLIAYSLLLIVSAMVVIVAIDVPFQLWQYYDQLKMSKEEVKQEFKEMEGDPRVKGRIRSLQREAARRRMMAAVPKANVIVTNPTHYAVALAYSSGMVAPKVVAKGMGAIAQKIKELGAEHGVPMLEAPPLARALYKHAELDAEIPAGLYAAVAEVLAYVYQLNRWREVGGGQPQPPRQLPVPPELVPEAA